MEEFGPEQVRAEEKAKLEQAIDYFSPVIMQWIERAFKHGYNSQVEGEEDAYIEFCETYGIDDFTGD